jgi:ABC-2 type transport system permease protein
MGARSLLSHSLRIAWKDLTELKRNRFGLVLLIVMPLFMLALVGFIYPTSGSSASNLPVAVVDLDAGYHNSTVGSQTFIAVLDEINSKTGMMKLSSEASVSDVKTSIQSGNLEGAIIIPSNFSASLLTGKQGTLIIMTDQSNPQISATMETLLSGVFSEMGTSLAQQNVQALSPAVNESDSLAVVQPYKVQTQGVVPGTSNYFDFLAPGIMAMVVMMSVMTGLPGAISQEKEIGTMDGMMVAPINRLSIILGKTLSQTVRGMLQGAIILVLVAPARGVQLRRFGDSADLVREGPADGDYADDHADVPHDVPERGVLPDTADALVYAGHIEGAPAHLRVGRPEEGHGAGCRDSGHHHGSGRPDRLRSCTDRDSRPRVQATDD